VAGSPSARAYRSITFLPDDVIENTIKAFNANPTSLDG
jgi:hypothetical protein